MRKSADFSADFLILCGFCFALNEAAPFSKKVYM